MFTGSKRYIDAIFDLFINKSAWVVWIECAASEQMKRGDNVLFIIVVVIITTILTNIK